MVLFGARYWIYLCFNPLHCGAVVASQYTVSSGRYSVHVSIPFIAGQWSLPRTQNAPSPTLPRFNPLHCGAVVASTQQPDRNPRQAPVSIPFIAGQWSLQEAADRERAQERGFNPLHCGAVVASCPPYGGRSGKRRVSIPFIAGQWSLLAKALGMVINSNKFQSPSLRGSGRFAMGFPGRSATSWSFNPLHCGAVVASAFIKSWGIYFFFSFNPLHCGAVVASSLPGGGSWWLTKSFNPLHCGAVVASRHWDLGERVRF